MSSIKSIISIGVASVATIAAASSTVTSLVRHHKVETLFNEVEEIHTNIQDLLNDHINVFKAKFDIKENLGDFKDMDIDGCSIINIINMKLEITNAFTSIYYGNGTDISFNRLITFNKEMKKVVENLTLLKTDFEVLRNTLEKAKEENISNLNILRQRILESEYSIFDKYITK